MRQFLHLETGFVQQRRFHAVRILVVFVSGVIMDELVELLNLFVPLEGFPLFLFPFLFAFLDDFESIATEISTSRRAVLLPRLQANPAEIVLAFGTLHMIAAFVFLNGRLTGGTRFRVGDEPEAVEGYFGLGIRVVQFLGPNLTDFLLPVDPVRAGTRLVSVSQTFPTEEMIVAAIDRV